MSIWEVLINLFVTLFGTFVGVYWAFWLDRRQQEAQASKRYADTLNAARTDLANLGSLCNQLSRYLLPGREWATMSPLEAPVVDAARINPAFHDQAPHGLVMCFTVIVTLRGTLQNELEHAKLALAPEFAALVQRANQLIRVIDYVQGLLGEEVRLLGQPLVSSSRDMQVIEGLEKAMKGDNVQAPARPS